MSGDGKTISRRAMLIAGGGTVVAAVSGGAALGRPGQRDAGPAGAVGLFDVGKATELLPPTPLHDVTGPQSIAFDGGQLYALQVMQGGIRLPDEKRHLSGRARRLAGDLCVTAFSRSGAAAQHMYLRGFGHGISMGVEPAEDGPLLWVESQADARTGYGRAVTRVPFRGDTVLDSSSPSVRHHRPWPTSQRVHPAIDVAAKRLMVSHSTGSRHFYTIHHLDDFLAGTYRPLLRVEDTALRSGETLQGCALHGNHIYQLTGSPYTDDEGTNPPASGGNTYVSAIDIRSGKAAGRRKVTQARQLSFREPEGLAIRPTADPALCVAFSVKSPGRRRLAVYACPS